MLKARVTLHRVKIMNSSPCKERTTRIQPNVFVKWLTLLLRIRESPVSNLVSATGYSVDVFRRFSQSLQTNFGIVS
jgi:hypothetical protein